MDTPRYPVPATRHRAEHEVRRSRFIATIGYAPTVEDARAFIARVRDEFADATHNCWAYVVGPPGSTGQVGLSDDGEPHGTAGRPMLAALLHADVGDIVVVVTRYFGGTKLGKGGLVRAYTDAVQRALADLPRREHVHRVRLAVQIGYAAIDAFRRLLPAHEAEVLDETYGTAARYTLALPATAVDRFRSAVLEVTGGQAAIDVLEFGD